TESFEQQRVVIPRAGARCAPSDSGDARQQVQAQRKRGVDPDRPRAFAAPEPATAAMLASRFRRSESAGSIRIAACRSMLFAPTTADASRLEAPATRLLRRRDPDRKS